MNLKKTIICISIINLLALGIFAQDCICPTVEVIEPSGVLQSGEPAVFTAEVSGDKGQTTYNWSIDAGTIIEGQGTSVIKVDTDGLEDTAITATVEVGGWCAACDNMSKSGTAVIGAKIQANLLDRFGHNNCEEVLARMDNFYINLQNNPAANGYIITYGNPRAIASAERQIRNSIKFRNFDATRITFINGGGTNKPALIEQWLVPPGAEPPAPNGQPEDDGTGATIEPEFDKTKPYIFSGEFADGIGGCVDPLDVEGFAAALKENPKSRGNIVIYETSQKLFRQKEKEILGQLTKSGIARNRLRTFYKKVEVIQEGIELWLLP